MSFSIIAAIGRNNELGNANGLIFKIKEDMQFFKSTTMGHKIVMGHKTWLSLPRKLPGRTSLVVSRNPVPGADDTITDLMAFIREYQHSAEEIFVIGGAMIYNEFLSYCDTLYLTEINAEAPADVFFPHFDKSQFTREIIKKGNQDDLTFTFVKYTKKK